MTLVVVWTKSIHGFTLITLLFPEKCPWNSVEMFSMTLVVRWTNSTYWFTLITFLLQGRYPWVLLWSNSTHGFTLITLLLQEKCPWNSVAMCRITLVVP